MKETTAKTSTCCIKTKGKIVGDLYTWGGDSLWSGANLKLRIFCKMLVGSTHSFGKKKAYIWSN